MGFTHLAVVTFVPVSLVLFLGLSACQQIPVANNQASLPAEARLQDFLLQSVSASKQNKGRESDRARDKKIPKLSHHDWKDFKPRSRCERSPELLITDILLTETGEKIMGPDAPAALTPNYDGAEIRLTLKGTFEKRNEKAFKLKDFLFQLESPLVQQSFIGHEPQARVLLDDSILLQVESVTATEIKARLNSKLLPDLYLKGV